MLEEMDQQGWCRSSAAIVGVEAAGRLRIDWPELERLCLISSKAS